MPKTKTLDNVRQRRGHRAAETWYSNFHARGKKADGYLFPSDLRQAYVALPPAEQCHFLDAIGALLVMWQVSGQPAPGRINLANEMTLQALSALEQAAANGEMD